MGKSIKYRLAFLLSMAAFFAACNKSDEQQVKNTDPDLKFVDGTYRYNGNLYNGAIVTYTSGGSVAKMEKVMNGKLEGEAKAWFENGHLREKMQYKKGLKMGIDSGFWPNGKLRCILHFSNDSLDGNQEKWNYMGQCISDLNYSNGMQIGMQRTWDEKGNLVANYEVRNGRQYGLKGGKYCDTTNLIK